MLPMLTREDERGAVRLKVRHNEVHHTVRHNEVRHTLCHNVRYRPSRVLLLRSRAPQAPTAAVSSQMSPRAQ